MAITYKILGQSNPSANTTTDLYTVPSATSAVCSTLVICNQVSTAATFRVAVCPAGDTVEAKHYLAYDVDINAKDSITMTIGITLAAADVVRVYSSTANISFNLFGSETT